jgi:phage gpG-like protein
MAARVFEDLEAFEEFLAVEIVRQREGLERSARLSLVALKKNVRWMYGQRGKLKNLAASTQADRVRKGYTPNNPLLRDGRLLRDKVQGHVDSTVKTSNGIDQISAGVGSHEVINAYHEHGYVNARTGKSVPPRPVFRLGAEMTEPEVARIIRNEIKDAL